MMALEYNAGLGFLTRFGKFHDPRSCSYVKLKDDWFEDWVKRAELVLSDKLHTITITRNPIKRMESVCEISLR